MLPIIGKKTEDKQKDILKYQQEMRKLLSDWEIENKCFIAPRLVAIPKSNQYQVILDFMKLDNDKLCEYQRQINAHENNTNGKKDPKTD